MYIVSLTYKVPIEAILEELPNHIEYLKKYYAEGVFLASGRKEPRVGGVILAEAENKEILSKILAQDPFKLRNLADYEITEFVASMTRDDLKCLQEE